MNINALPVEILDCIISHIPTPQPHLAALCLVQRDWYHFFSRRLYRKPTFAKPEHLLLFLHRLTPRHVPLLLELDLAPHPGLVDDALLLQLVGLLSSSASTPQLTHIDLTGCTSITAHGFVPLLTSLGGTLTSARLGRCSRITNLSLTLLAVHSPNLHTLGLANTTLFDPHALSPLALYARHTHTLDLSHCPWVTNATLLSDLRPLSGLRSVRLSGCAGVSAEGVRGMASAHPRVFAPAAEIGIPGDKSGNGDGTGGGGDWEGVGGTGFEGVLGCGKNGSRDAVEGKGGQVVVVRVATSSAESIDSVSDKQQRA
ncbi:hypothetical protein BC938DRAFT_474429 [Jimgerdemannia flammicorona]|uniref:Uncharacterized protein n=1 Tax=Jimgerdemannia flammicorona TaxID=994334 RepID=A0A433Q299_9FUNG|nr:hypothetical protein BC938DRAFT_474429 [Jimgerdemannia flammicorona]